MQRRERRGQAVRPRKRHDRVRAVRKHAVGKNRRAPVEQMQGWLDNVDRVLLPVLYDERLDVPDVADVAGSQSV